MHEEFVPSGNYEAPVQVEPLAEKKVHDDVLPMHRSPLITAPENQPFRELLLEFDQYLGRWYRALSAPEYLVEHTKYEKKETWFRGFDILQSGAHLHVVPLATKQQERPEGGVARITSESMVRPIYRGFPYDNFFVPIGNRLIEVATLTDPESNLPIDSFYVTLENLQEQDSALIDPYNNQPLTSFYLSAYREDFLRPNPTQQKYIIHVISQTYDVKARRFRDYGVVYALRKNRLSVKISPFAPKFSKFLSPDHSKTLFSLVDSLMPQDDMAIPDEGNSMVQQEETSSNDL